MVHILKQEIPSITLLEDDYEKYCKKFPRELKRGITFSNQVKLHDKLRVIKESNQFTEEFFTATRCYTNANNILKDKNSKESNQHQSQSIIAESSSNSLILCNKEPPMIVKESLNNDLDNNLDQIQAIQQ
ncbi:8627_t:CDS:2 [Gigaspora margarita]|uniref:8627_t:CDS:1 n=1 Tax=Gigaspora margarita TaxID=4874 RepID=A0ABN7V893_GIGMA|nr:8627_t:CDS:2 [Gigaspora margarita]